MTKISGAVWGIVGGILGAVLGGLIILGTHERGRHMTQLSGGPGLRLGLWFILAGSLAVLMVAVGHRQALIRGIGLLAGVVVGAAGVLSMSSQQVHKAAALLMWMIAGIPMTVGAVLALRSTAHHDGPPAAALPAGAAGGAATEAVAPQAPAGVCSQCGAPLPSAELPFCPTCGAERVREQS